MRYILIQTTAAPYASSHSIDALEAALAATNIGMSVKFIFIDDGLYQLANNQQSQAVGHKNLAKKLSALPLFDVDDVYVCTESAKKRHINLVDNTLMASLSANVIDNKQLLSLVEHADHVLVF